MWNIFKVSNKETRKTSFKFSLNSSESPRFSDDFRRNWNNAVPVSLLMTLFLLCLTCVSMIDFELVKVCWYKPEKSSWSIFVFNILLDDQYRSDQYDQVYLSWCSIVMYSKVRQNFFQVVREGISLMIWVVFKKI